MALSSVQPWPVSRVCRRYLMDQRLLLRGAGSTLHGRTKDISENGLGAVVAGELNTNETLELEFYLPGKLNPVKLAAEVRYHQGFQYGFQFMDINDQQRNMIRESIIVLPPA
jgi:PilZ domain-containing protein